MPVIFLCRTIFIVNFRPHSKLTVGENSSLIAPALQKAPCSIMVFSRSESSYFSVAFAYFSGFFLYLAVMQSLKTFIRLTLPVNLT